MPMPIMNLRGSSSSSETGFSESNTAVTASPMASQNINQASLSPDETSVAYFGLSQIQMFAIVVSVFILLGVALVGYGAYKYHKLKYANSAKIDMNGCYGSFQPNPALSGHGAVSPIIADSEGIKIGDVEMVTIAESDKENAKGEADIHAELKLLKQEIRIMQQQHADDIEYGGSMTRVLMVMFITYCVVCFYMTFTLVSHNPALEAIVPVIGFNLSTWSIPAVKMIWRKYRRLYENPWV